VFLAENISLRYHRSIVADIGSNNLRCPKTYCKNLTSLLSGTGDAVLTKADMRSCRLQHRLPRVKRTRRIYEDAP
jgi:hypothetical protein